MAKTRKYKDSTPLKDGGGKRKRGNLTSYSQSNGVEVGSPSNQQKKRKGKTKEATFKGKIEYQFLQGDAFYGRFNINCHQLFVREIENRLSSTDWKRIEDGPFGKIIKILKQVSFSSHLVHAVLFTQLKTEKKWETWYGVGGRELRFSMKEFSLISGLSCGVPPAVDTKGDKNVMKRFFGALRSHKISVQDVYERFKDHRDHDNYKFKLALLLIVEGLIMGVIRKG